VESRWDNMSTNELFQELRETEREELRDYLIERHEGLVRHVTWDYSSSGESYDDILSVGHVGLINAVDRYDPSRGTKFATFAIPTIKGEIQRHFRDQTWGLRVPRRIQELSMKAREAGEELTQRFGRSPTYQELATRLGVTAEDVIEAIEVGRQYELASIDSREGGSGEGDSRTIAEMQGEEDEELEHIADRDQIREALRHLPARQQTIIALRFFRDMSQEQVGERLGISQMHVSRLQRKALRHLRSVLEQ
jgi:RNA polymerase sigma-B factor